MCFFLFCHHCHFTRVRGLSQATFPLSEMRAGGCVSLRALAFHCRTPHQSVQRVLCFGEPGNGVSVPDSGGEERLKVPNCSASCLICRIFSFCYFFGARSLSERVRRVAGDSQTHRRRRSHHKCQLDQSSCIVGSDISYNSRVYRSVSCMPVCLGPTN